MDKLDNLPGQQITIFDGLLNLENLPEDMKITIFDELTNLEKIVMFFVCKRFRKICNENYKINWNNPINREVTKENTEIWEKYYEWGNDIGLSIDNRITCAIIIEDNNMKLLEYVYKRKFGIFNSLAFNTALYHSNIEILELLLKENCETNDNFLFHIASSGNIVSLEWLEQCILNNKTNIKINLEVQLYDEIIVSAIVNNNLDFLKWLYVKNNTIINPYFIGCAAYNGKNEIIKWMFEDTILTPDNFVNSDAYYQAALGGHLNTVKLLFNYNISFGTNDLVCAGAIAGKHLDILAFCIIKKCPKGTFSTKAAASTGNIALLVYLIEKGFLMEQDTVAFAVHEGHIDFVKYLYENNYQFDLNACCEKAANRGFKDILNYGISLGYKPTYKTIACAANGNSIDMMKYLFEMNIKFDIEIFRAATYNCRTLAISYLRENGYEWDESVTDFAIESNQFNMFMWLIHKGCPFNLGHENIILEYLKNNIKPEIKNIIIMFENIEWTKEIIKQVVDSYIKVTMEIYGDDYY